MNEIFFEEKQGKRVDGIQGFVNTGFITLTQNCGLEHMITY